MKKCLFFILLVLIYTSGISQVAGSRKLLGQDTSTNTGGKIYLDTVKTLACSGCSFNKGTYADTLVIPNASNWVNSGSDVYILGKATIGSSTILRTLTLDNATPPLMGMSVSGTEKLLMGISNGANNLIPGTVAGDFALRSVSGIFLSANSGTNNHLSIATSGNVLIPVALGVGDRAPTTRGDFYSASVSNVVTSQSGATATLADFQALNNLGNGFQAGSLGSAYGVSGLLNSNYTFFQANGSDALVFNLINTVAKPIIIGETIATVATEYARWNTSGHFIPGTTVTYDLGTSALAWRDVYLSHPVGESTIGVSSSLGTNVTSITPAGNDAYFQLTVVTSGNTTGTNGLIAFGRTWGATPKCVISSADAATGTMIASAGGYVALKATSTSSMTLAGVFTGAGTWVFNCHCGQ